MYSIEWTKEYEVCHNDRFSKIFISKHGDGLFFGGVLYYHKSGSFTENTCTLRMKLKNFVAESEEQVLAQCRSWIDANLGADYDLTGPELA